MGRGGRKQRKRIKIILCLGIYFCVLKHTQRSDTEGLEMSGIKKIIRIDPKWIKKKIALPKEVIFFLSLRNKIVSGVCWFSKEQLYTEKEFSCFHRFSNCSAAQKKSSLVAFCTCTTVSFCFSILTIMPVAKVQHKPSCVYNRQTIGCTPV